MLRQSIRFLTSSCQGSLFCAFIGGPQPLFVPSQAIRTSQLHILRTGLNNIVTSGDTSAGEDVKKVVIFDKDGTLTCMHAMWAPWLIQTAKRLEEATGLSLQAEVCKAMGFDQDSKKFGPGLLMECTHQACVEYICQLLEKRGVPTDRANRIATECYGVADASLTGEVVEFGATHDILSRLRDDGYYIAVDTSDNRITTEGTLDRLGVSHLVDMVVCGNDAGTVPKPDAYTALKICAHLGVEPKDAVFVGDTITDAMCGRNSNCGLVISVLTGGIDRSVLEKTADHVVDSVGEAANLILSQTVGPNTGL